MRVWEIKARLDNSRTFQLSNFENDYSKYFKGKFGSNTPLADIWGNIVTETADEGEQNDCVHFWGESGVYVFSEKAKKIYEGIGIEFLPLVHKNTGEIYYAIHVMNILDTVDYSKTTFEKLNTGLVIGFEKICFKPDVLTDVDIFMVYLYQNVYTTSVFVSDRFKDVALMSDLKGFIFNEVWDSEA